MRSTVFWILSLAHLCFGQVSEDDRGLLNRRRRPQSSPCYGGGYSDNIYDSIEDESDGRHLLLAAGAAAGGAALGYHVGMKHKTPVVINNNIHNDYPSPCVVVQNHGGGLGGGGGGGGLVGGILGHHPILSNILQGGLWNGGGGGSSSGAWSGSGGGNRFPLNTGNRFPINGGNRLPVNRENTVNWNRAIRQFNRAIRPLTRFR